MCGFVLEKTNLHTYVCLHFYYSMRIVEKYTYRNNKIVINYSIVRLFCLNVYYMCCIMVTLCK